MRHATALLLVSLFGTGCGGRSLTSSDSGSNPPPIQSEAGIPTDGSPTGPDGCVRPPGGCFSTKDCPAGQECQGCGADPCCPMCAVCYGKCVPSTSGCKSNKDCGQGMYCNLGPGCGKTGTGTCMKKPGGCLMDVDQVCGCDGKTYSNFCAAATAGISVAHEGECTSCASLNSSYMAAVKQAKMCSTLINKLTCTLKVKDSLGCPCDTYVEDSNTSAMQTMKQLEKQWISQMCGTWYCAKSCGPSPSIGACKAAGPSTTGTCEDLYSQ